MLDLGPSDRSVAANIHVREQPDEEEEDEEDEEDEKQDDEDDGYAE